MKLFVSMLFILCSLWSGVQAGQDLVSVLYVDDQYFEVKGHYYPLDGFQVKKGRCF